MFTQTEINRSAVQSGRFSGKRRTKGTTQKTEENLAMNGTEPVCHLPAGLPAGLAAGGEALSLEAPKRFPV